MLNILLVVQIAVSIRFVVMLAKLTLAEWATENLWAQLRERRAEEIGVILIAERTKKAIREKEESCVTAELS